MVTMETMMIMLNCDGSDSKSAYYEINFSWNWFAFEFVLSFMILFTLCFT